MRFTPRQPTKEQPYLYDRRCLTNDVQQTCQHAAVPCMAFAFVCQGACALDLCCNCSFRPILSNRVAEWHTTGTQRCDAIGPPLLIPNIFWARELPVNVLCIWVVAIVVVIAFGGPYRFPGICGNQHVRDPTWSQNPFLNRLGNGSMIEELFCRFQVLRQHFMFLSFCIHLHASSFIFLSFAFIFLSFCIRFPSFSFQSPFMFLYFHL